MMSITVDARDRRWRARRVFNGKTDHPTVMVNFHGESRKNDTHASTTDPDAKLYRRSYNAEARLAYLGHLVIENRHGLIVDAMATTADGRAERDAAVVMLRNRVKRRGRRRRTVGADKGYDTHGFIAATRDLGVTPHVTQNLRRRGGAIDGTHRHDDVLQEQPRALASTGLRWPKHRCAQSQIPRPAQVLAGGVRSAVQFAAATHVNGHTGVRVVGRTARGVAHRFHSLPP